MKILFAALLFCLFLPAIGFAMGNLADGWWLQDSPENVLARAQSINQGLNFFHAKKTGSTSSKITNPFARTNDNEHTDFFQKRNADGSVETKNVHVKGNYQWTDYKLKNGHYFFTDGQIIKAEFAEGEDLEKMIAVEIDHPYEFKILKPERVGTNDCFVIARTMTEPLLKAAENVYYEKYPPEKRIEFGTNYIRTETDFYFRKNDGVTFGSVKRNCAGELLNDNVYDNVEIDQPIAEQAFALPKGDIKIAESSDECQKILGELRAAKLAKTRKNPATALSEKRASELPWATDLSRALKQAKSESKIVLLDFTGSDWCVWCIKFDDDVLSQPEFAAYAKTKLVMVLLDFPNAIKQTKALKKANASLQAKFKVDGFPTYVALNSDGKEIGRQVGYLSGGPQAFIAELEKFQKQ